MKTYHIAIVGEINITASTSVEAESADEATRKVRDRLKLHADEFDWEFPSNSQTPEITAVEVIDEEESAS